MMLSCLENNIVKIKTEDIKIFVNACYVRRFDLGQRVVKWKVIRYAVETVRSISGINFKNT